MYKPTVNWEKCVDVDREMLCNHDRYPNNVIMSMQNFIDFELRIRCY